MTSNLYQRIAGSITLSMSRRLLRFYHGRPLAVLIGSMYSIATLYIEFFVSFDSTSFPLTFQIFSRTGQINWWDFPYILILSPHFQLVLPLLSAVAIAITAVVVGIGAVAATVVLLLMISRKEGFGFLKPQVGVGLMALGLMALVSPVIMELVARFVALSSSEGYVQYMYAWYLPLLEMSSSLALVIVLELVLQKVGASSTHSHSSRAVANGSSDKDQS